MHRRNRIRAAALFAVFCLLSGVLTVSVGFVLYSGLYREEKAGLRQDVEYLNAFVDLRADLFWLFVDSSEAPESSELVGWLKSRSLWLMLIGSDIPLYPPLPDDTLISFNSEWEPGRFTRRRVDGRVFLIYDGSLYIGEPVAHIKYDKGQTPGEGDSSLGFRLAREITSKEAAFRRGMTLLSVGQILLCFAVGWFWLLRPASETEAETVSERSGANLPFFAVRSAPFDMAGCCRAELSKLEDDAEAKSVTLAGALLAEAPVKAAPKDAARLTARLLRAGLLASPEGSALSVRLIRDGADYRLSLTAGSEAFPDGLLASCRQDAALCGATLKAEGSVLTLVWPAPARETEETR